MRTYTDAELGMNSELVDRLQCWDFVTDKASTAFTSTSILIGGYNAYLTAAATISPSFLFTNIPYFAMLEGVLTSAVALKDIYKNHQENRPFQLRNLMDCLSGLQLTALGSCQFWSIAAISGPTSLGIIAIGYAVKSGADLLQALNILFTQTRVGTPMHAKAKQEVGYHLLKFIGWGALIVGGFASGPVAIAGFAIGGVALGLSFAVGLVCHVPIQGFFTKTKLLNGTPQLDESNEIKKNSNDTPRRLMALSYF